ncbi:MAG: radical SAM protein [Proteobacteria bacterium]|nr:radical SAM protein [Pseudomonadota bacterium]
MTVLDLLDKTLLSQYESCELCPRRCKVDRIAGQLGVCREGVRLRIATIEAHLGEEPPISNLNGSGTVFISGCSLRCILCQNHQISREGVGREWTPDDVVDRLERLYKNKGIHNVNFVTPDHFFPHMVAVVRLLRERGVHVPIVHNVSGYQRIDSLRQIETVADIYLADFKYADATLADRLSGSSDYAAVALGALSEMIRQKGFLDTFATHGNGKAGGEETENRVTPARGGVLVRHLILPGQIHNSLQVLTMLFVEFGRDLPLSLLSQYTPVRQFQAGSPLNCRVRRDEFHRVLDHSYDLGFRNVYVQYPKEITTAEEAFLPDFRPANPFRGNVRNQC